MRLSRCAQLQQSPLTGTWYRAIQPQHWNTSLGTAHTVAIPSRFNAGTSSRYGFEILYLAADHQIALFEVGALLGDPYGQFVPNPRSPWTIINVNVRLRHVVDLTQLSELSLIRTTVQELTGDWRGYRRRNPNPVLRPPYRTDVPTQKLGAALFAVPELEGFLTWSAKCSAGKNLIVFPTKLRAGSRIEFHDSATGQTHVIRPRRARKKK